MDSRDILWQAHQLNLSLLQLLVLQGSLSLNAKCSGSVPCRIATTLALPAAPGSMDVMGGGGLMAWVAPAAATRKQRSKWSSSMEGTMKKGVEVILRAGRGSVVARRGLAPTPSVVHRSAPSTPSVVRAIWYGVWPRRSPARRRYRRRRKKAPIRDSWGCRRWTPRFLLGLAAMCTTTLRHCRADNITREELMDGGRHQRSRCSTAGFSTRLTSLQGIVQTVGQTAWQRTSVCIKPLPLTDWLRALSRLCWTRVVPTYTRRTTHWHSVMLLEVFYMLEVCCGSGASSRAMITYMRRIGREGRSLLVDIITLDLLLLTYPELKPYLEDGSIIYFEACLTQTRQGDLQLLVEGLLGIPWSKLHSYHVSLACTTWSWACLSKKRYRTLEGAAMDIEAQVMEKLPALTLPHTPP